MAGRPTKLTDDLAAKIVQVIRAGNYREVAARFAGVAPETLTRWLTRGEKEKCGVYATFRQSVLEAEEAAEIESVGCIRRLVKDGDLKAATWYLERKFPERWGRKDHLRAEVKSQVQAEVKSEVSAKVDVRPDLSKLSTESLRALAKIQEEIDAAQVSPDEARGR